MAAAFGLKDDIVVVPSGLFRIGDQEWRTIPDSPSPPVKGIGAAKFGGQVSALRQFVFVHLFAIDVEELAELTVRGHFNLRFNLD